MRFLAVLLAISFAASAQKLPPKYATWLEEEVPYLITKDERKDFVALKSEADRERFIQEFWDARNPARTAGQNPVKDEHYRRIEYANLHFGRMSGTPGWRTDMGRTYILFGPPQSRAPYIGYGQIYPLELWFYTNKTGNPSLPPFFYLLFYMPDDIGEFQYYRPAVDGPMKLVRGSQFRGNADVYRFLKPLNPELARAAFSLIPGEPLDTDEFRPSIASEMLVSKVQGFADDPFNVSRIREARSLRERVKSWFLVAQNKPLEASHFVWSDPAGQLWLDLAFLAESVEFGKLGAGQFALNYGFRLLTPEGALIVEDNEDRAFPMTGEFEPFLLANRVPLAPGKYKLELHVTNREASRTWRAERIIEAEPPQALTIRGPMLALAAAKAAHPDAAAPFQYFGAQLTPAAGRSFSTRSPIYALFELRAPPEDGASLYKIEYVLASPQSRESRRIVSDEVKTAEFRDGVLLKSKTLPLGQLEPGDYRLVINVRKDDQPQVLASTNTPVRIGTLAPAPQIYFAGTSKAVTAPGVAPYIRALQELATNQEQPAVAHLRQSLDANPANASALHALVRIYFRQAKYDQIAALYKGAGETAFRTSSETLAQTALSFWRIGERDQARTILKAGDSYFPKDAILQSAARAIDKESVP
jgi:GWxTD domain-containing protein